MVTTLYLASPYTTENLTRVRVPMLKPRQFPGTAGGASKSNCPAPSLGYSPTIPVGGVGGGGLDTNDGSGTPRPKTISARDSSAQIDFFTGTQL